MSLTKKVVAATAGAVLVAGGAIAAIAATAPSDAKPGDLVQATGTYAYSSGASVSKKFTNDVKAGDLLTVSVSFDAAGSPTASASDSEGNAWTADTNVHPGASDRALVQFHAVAKADGADTVKVSFNAAKTQRYISIAEYAVGTVATTPPPTTEPPSTPPAPTTNPPTTDPPTTQPPTTQPPSSTPPPSTQPPASGDFPNASNTGVPAGTTLTSYTGPLSITADNTVISGKKITLSDSFRISAKNVVIKDSYIDAGDNYWAVMVDSGNVTIQDCEIVGSDAAAVATDSGSYNLNRDNIHGFHGDGMKLGDNVTVENSWIHDAVTLNGQHADGMQLQGGASNVVIKNNSVDLNEDEADAAVFIKNDLGPNNTAGPVTVDHNLLGGGGFSLYVYKGGSGLEQGGVTVTNNRFLRDYGYGPVAVNIPVVQWSGNVYDDTGATISNQ